MNNLKPIVSRRLHLRRLFVCFVFILILCGETFSLIAQDRGNTTAQEYGDAVYRELEGIAGFLGYDYNHTAVFAGFDSSGNGKVLQALGSGYVTHEADFYDQFTSYGTYYYGAYTLNNRTMSFTDRKSVVTTAIGLVNAAIPYPDYFLIPPVCIVYYGNSFDGTITDISNIRCDGFVEYCYEKNNFRVWRNQDYVDADWSIVLYPDLNNDRPDNTRNPEDEASPWTQRGAPCTTGPISGLGCSYLSPDTKMTSAAVIHLPTYQVTTNGGPGYLDVTIQATDESGIHLIGVVKPGEASWTYSPTQPQHPTSASYSWTVRITNNGSLYYAALDNGGNAPTVAQTPSVTVFVPPPDTTKPTVSIINPAANARFTNNAAVTVQGTATDNWQVAAVNYQLNAGGWSLATGTTNWQTTVNLVPGTNVFQAFSVDSAGNNSLTNSRTNFLVLTAPIVVQINGAGSISPNYNRQSLEIGKGYSMTATPATGFRFTNWTGSLITSSATLNFTMASNLIFIASFIDTNKPVLSITNLAAGQRWSNAVFTVRGTAGDNWQVSNVWYQLNGLECSNAVTVNAWSNWSAALDLVPGTNSIKAYAVDSTGLVSTTNNLSFDFVVTNQLQIRAIGLGTIQPNYSNAWLEIGRNYSITSSPASGFMFTNWLVASNGTGGALVTGTNLQFMMQSNLTLQANFLDVAKPTLTITAPTSGQKMTNALAIVTGTASDNWQISNVWYQLNGGVWNPGTTANSFTNWTTTTTLVVGTNVLKAFALDLGGNFSLTNGVSFVSSNTFKLQMNFTLTQPLTSTGLNFSLQISPGLNGHIQVSTNLSTWTALTNFAGTNATLNFRDPAATNFTQRFYRAVIP